MALGNDDTTSGISGLDFNFGTKDSSRRSIRTDEHPLEKMKANGFQQSQTQSKTSNQEVQSSTTGLKNPFAEFKYDNDAFNVFDDGKSSTSPFFPF